MEDKELLKLLKKNPQKGFSAMVERYGGLLYALVRAKLIPAAFGSAQVEDIVADSFSDFYLGLRSFDPNRCSVKSYLCVIARNKATDALRRSRFVPLPLEEDVVDVDDQLEEAEIRADLLREIAALGEPDSVILIRKYYLGETSADIAGALNMTAANVDTRASRAIGKLRKAFAHTEVHHENNCH